VVRGQTLPPEWWLDESGCLKGAHLYPPGPPGTLALRSPQGFKLNSRGQGHALGARRPRITPPKRTDPEGVARFGPSRAERLLKAPAPWVPPTATHVAPLRGARNSQNSSGLTGRTSGLPKSVAVSTEGLIESGESRASGRAQSRDRSRQAEKQRRHAAE